MWYDCYPVRITHDGFNLYEVDWQNDIIRKIAIETRDVTTFAGLPITSGFAYGIGSAAKFYQPLGITTDDTYISLSC
jgi:hypothetical protein